MHSFVWFSVRDSKPGQETALVYQPGPLHKTLHTISIYRSSEQQQWCPRWLTLSSVPSSPPRAILTTLGTNVQLKGAFPHWGRAGEESPASVFAVSP